MPVPRLILHLLVAAIATFVAIGCGGDAGTSKGGKDPAGTGDAAPFDASRIPQGAPGVIVRLDQDRLDASFEVLRRVSGVRAAEEDLPSRDEAVRSMLTTIGIDVPARAGISAWIGDEVGATRTPDGWAAWANIRDGRTKEAERFAARADDVAARIEGDELVVAANERALRAVSTVDEALADDDRWKQLDDARSMDGALVVATDGEQVAVAGTDEDGIWVAGRGGTRRDCEQGADDSLEAVGDLSVGTTVGLAHADAVTTKQAAAWLRAGMQALEPVRRQVPEGGVVTRVVGALDRAVAATMQVLDEEVAAPGAALGLQDVGTANPAISMSDEEESGTLAADPGFAATRALVDVDGPVDMALWLDPVRIIRAVGESQLDGIEGAVVGALGDGIDGILVWRSCDGELGARVAIPG